MIDHESMVKGGVYRLIFDIGAKLPREATMRFLEGTKDTLIFDLRPMAGTQDIRKRDVMEMYKCYDYERLSMPKIYRGGTRVY